MLNGIEEDEYLKPLNSFLNQFKKNLSFNEDDLGFRNNVNHSLKTRVRKTQVNPEDFFLHVVRDKP